jgi:transketolase
MALCYSNNTLWKGSVAIDHRAKEGNYIYYGVREFAMSAIMNGIALHGGFIPYGGTFLVFSDYARNALRMAALARIHSLFVYSHDSIGVGEDGPTHQPVEHLASLRLIPNMSVWRPCDASEVAVAWKSAIERRDGPTCLIFSRQKLPHQCRDSETLALIQRGGYILRDCEGTAQAILIATGSEVQLAVEAAASLTAEGHRIRVVSMPSVDIFELQDTDYRNSVLPPQVTQRIVVESGASGLWPKYAGPHGKVIGLDCYGTSAPGGEVFKFFGFTVENVIQIVKKLL